MKDKMKIMNYTKFYTLTSNLMCNWSEILQQIGAATGDKVECTGSHGPYNYRITGPIWPCTPSAIQLLDIRLFAHFDILHHLATS